MPASLLVVLDQCCPEHRNNAPPVKSERDITFDQCIIKWRWLAQPSIDAGITSVQYQTFRTNKEVSFVENVGPTAFH